MFYEVFRPVNKAEDLAKAKTYRDCTIVYDDIKQVILAGLMVGSGDEFRPRDLITREEFYVILVRAFQLPKGSGQSIEHFSDADKVSNWALPSVAAMVKAGYVKQNQRLLEPDKGVTVGEFALLMDQFIQSYIRVGGNYEELPERGSLLITAPNVRLINVTVDGDLIIGDGVGNGLVFLQNVKVNGRVVVCLPGVSHVGIDAQSRVEVDVNAVPFLKVGQVLPFRRVTGDEMTSVIAMVSRDLGITMNRRMPSGEEPQDIVVEIDNFYEENYRVIVGNGEQFASVAVDAANKYPDAKFIAIDAERTDTELPLNLTYVSFDKTQAGFVAGVAASLGVQSGGIGFIGGAQTEWEKKYLEGVRDGIAYANSNLCTAVEFDEAAVVFAGVYDDSELGEQLAENLYNNGVSCIIFTSGDTATGVLAKAIERKESGQNVSVVSLGRDVYRKPESYGAAVSVTLASVQVNKERAVTDMIKGAVNGPFPGGQILLYDAANGGLQLSEENPCLTLEKDALLKSVLKKMASAEIVVENKQ